MPVCANCGTNNVEGVRFCVSCGTQVGEPPPPESWRVSSDLGSAQPRTPPDPASPGAPGAAGYTPQVPPPPPGLPAYSQQHGTPYYQQQQQPASQPMHPAVPAIVSALLPGIGLLFVPNKAGLGLGIFGGYIALIFVFIIFSFITLGLGACLSPLMLLANVVAAVHSWDEAAKVSGGQFQPIYFKN
jgi:hypothetical protein